MLERLPRGVSAGAPAIYSADAGASCNAQHEGQAGARERHRVSPQAVKARPFFPLCLRPRPPLQVLFSGAPNPVPALVHGIVGDACPPPATALVGAEAERAQQIALRLPDEPEAGLGRRRAPLFERQPAGKASLVWHRDSPLCSSCPGAAPSPRVRGEGRDEGASPLGAELGRGLQRSRLVRSAQNRGEAPSPSFAPLARPLPARGER